MYITAKKLGTTPAWLAWIPFINLALQAKMAKMSWLPLLALIFVWIPVLGMLIAFGIQVLAVIWLWKICEARGKEGWFSLLTLIPFLGGIWSLVLWGLLAWDDPKVPENKSPQKKAAKKKTAKKAIKK